MLGSFFKNDINEEIISNVSKFADDTKTYHQLASKNTRELQKDWNRLILFEKW